jgi:hypothetical protein
MRELTAPYDGFLGKLSDMRQQKAWYRKVAHTTGWSVQTDYARHCTYNANKASERFRCSTRDGNVLSGIAGTLAVNGSNVPASITLNWQFDLASRPSENIFDALTPGLLDTFARLGHRIGARNQVIASLDPNQPELILAGHSFNTHGTHRLKTPDITYSFDTEQNVLLRDSRQLSTETYCLLVGSMLTYAPPLLPQ